MSSSNIIECSDGISIEIETRKEEARLGITLEALDNELVAVKSISNSTISSVLTPGDVLIGVNSHATMDEDAEDVCELVECLRGSGHMKLKFLKVGVCDVETYRREVLDYSKQQVRRDKFGFRRNVDYIILGKDKEKELSSRAAVRDEAFVAYLKSIGGTQNLKPAGVFKCSDELKDVLRRGIPIAYKAAVWTEISLASVHRKNFPPEYYEDCVKRIGEIPLRTAEDIEKDIDRTFPDHEFFRDEGEGGGQLKLKRVLQAYAVHNPEVGYCQGINFIAGVLLLYMAEDDAFWLFVTALDTLLPEDYFSAGLVGHHVDQAVLAHFVKEYFPALSEKLEVNNIQIPMVTVGWIMPLFINTLRHDVSLRVLDVFFAEGSKVLFKVALALFRLNEQSLLASRDQGDLFMRLKELGKGIVDGDELLAAAYSGFQHHPQPLNLSARKLSPSSFSSLVEILSPRSRSSSGSKGGNSSASAGSNPQALSGFGLAHAGFQDSGGGLGAERSRISDGRLRSHSDTAVPIVVTEGAGKPICSDFRSESPALLLRRKASESESSDAPSSMLTADAPRSKNKTSSEDTNTAARRTSADTPSNNSGPSQVERGIASLRLTLGVSENGRDSRCIKRADIERLRQEYRPAFEHSFKQSEMARAEWRRKERAEAAALEKETINVVVEKVDKEAANEREDNEKVDGEKEEEDGESVWRDGGGGVGKGKKLDLSQEVDSSDAESDTTCGSDDVIDESYFAQPNLEQPEPEQPLEEREVQPTIPFLSWLAPRHCYTVEI